MDSVLSFVGIRRSFGRKRALTGLHLDVGQGEWVALVGPRGAGKTTAINLAAGLEPSEEGKITVAGRTAGDRLSFRDLGLVPDNGDLDPDRTVLANMQFYAALHGLARTETDRRVQKLLRLLELEDRGRDRVRSLNALDIKRTGIGCALVQHPRVLLLNDPCAGLDHHDRRALAATADILRKEEGLALLWATAEAAEADLADRIVVLHRGTIRFVGTPAEILAATGKPVLPGAVRAVIETEPSRELA